MAIAARTRFLRNLTAAFVSGEWTAAGLRSAAEQATGQRFRWVNALIVRVLAAFTERPVFEQLLAFIDQDAGFVRACRMMAKLEAWNDHPTHYPIRKVFSPPAVMTAPPAAMGPLAIPGLATEAALAEWLGVSAGKLRWFADITGRNCRHPAGPLRTYRHRWVPKRGGQPRLLEIPTGGLKRLQRKVLDSILNAIPPHPTAHGFRPGHSVVTNATPHCGKRIVLRFDLADFFPSVPAAKITRLFRTVGYPETVARLLAGLCTTRLPRDVWDARPNPRYDGADHAIWQRFAARHLPQGAPTSPALANLTAFRLDRRLAKLASSIGADYTRYADDLTFSGGEELARSWKRLAVLVAVIAGEEGFTLNFRKTRSMSRSARQCVTGVVVNLRPNVPRVEFDRLKAILTNCVRHGPASQNREKHPDFRAHLAGKVSHIAMVNPARGRKLWAIFDRIAWAAAPQG